jgi:predicted RNA-binding protein YlqC (UPF0109 family)
MENIVRYIVDNLVDEPSRITIETKEDDIILTVPKEYMGKIIGKQGRIAKAIRTIVKAAAGSSRKMNVEIVEA